jgi:hypothetical protein
MSRTQPSPATKKTARKTRDPERPIPDIDFSRNTWSVRMAAQWANVPTRTLYRLLRARTVPSILMGEAQTQSFAPAKSGKRARKCYRFLIPRVAFMKAWESVGAPADGQRALHA